MKRDAGRKAKLTEKSLQPRTPSSSTCQRQEKPDLWNEHGAHLQHSRSYCGSLNGCRVRGWPGSTPVTHFSREVPNQICNHASYYASSMEKDLQENNFISLLGSVSRCVGGNQRTRGHNHFSPFVWITGIELRSSSSAASPFTHCLTGLGNIFYKLIFIYKNSMHLGNRFSKTVFFLELDVVFVHTVIMLKSPYNTVQRYSITL